MYQLATSPCACLEIPSLAAGGSGDEPSAASRLSNPPEHVLRSLIYGCPASALSIARGGQLTKSSAKAL